MFFSCSTDYGESLIKEAFNLNLGEVETISHYYAAKYFVPHVDSIIDIGGQDMKYMKINNGVVSDIILNIDSKHKPLDLDRIINIEYKISSSHCKGCNNACKLTINEFSNGNKYISGNCCEKGLLEGTGDKSFNTNVLNLFEYKKKRLFDYKTLKKDEAIRGDIGIPRVLNMYENFPF